MTPKHLRLGLLLAGLVLALIAVAPVLAQGGEGTDPLADAASGQPEDLDDIAVRLMPLLVGAALIERTLEVLFTWLERTVLDASSSANRFASWLTGLVQVDFHQTWENLDRLTNAMLVRRASPQAAYEGDSDSEQPEHWPLAMLESKLIEAKQTLANAEAVIERLLSSPEYVARKKILAAWLSVAMGIALAFASSLRLFTPLGVEVADWFEGSFDALDLVLAGILMGLGTEYVHQVIGLLVKGKGALGRVGVGAGEAGNLLDPEQVRMLAEQAVTREIDAQMRKLGIDITEGVRSGVTAKKPGEPSEPPGT